MLEKKGFKLDFSLKIDTTKPTVDSFKIEVESKEAGLEAILKEVVTVDFSSELTLVKDSDSALTFSLLQILRSLRIVDKVGVTKKLTAK